MHIIKTVDGDASSCAHFTFSYENPKAGEGHFIHTYMHDGNPLPTFQGEPERVSIGNDIDAFTEALWESLDADNRISLYARFIEPETGAYEERLINRNR